MKSKSSTWNIILQLSEGHEYSHNNVSRLLNMWGLPDIFKYSQVTVGDLLMEDISRGVVLFDSVITKYERGHNQVMDILLESIWFKLISIVDNDWKEIIELKTT